MKLTPRTLGGALVSTLAATAMISASWAAGPEVLDKRTVSAASQPTAAADYVEDLRFLREEEKLARDVYITLYKRWNIRAFDNISGAEQRHMDRVGRLATARGLPDPVVDNSVGAFSNKVLAKLYTDLTKKGSASKTEALLVGATVEDLDIHDIQKMRARTNDAEVLKTYDVLECGSRNHMRAFTRLLKAEGKTYTPQYISQTDYDAIIAGEHERCGRKYGDRGGRGGRGHGRRGGR